MWKRLFFLGVVLALLTLTSIVGYCLGTVAGMQSERRYRFDFEKEQIAPILAANPAFAKVRPIMRPLTGELNLVGEVSTTTDLEHLRSKIVPLLGAARQLGPLLNVSVVEEKSQSNRRRGDD